MNPQDVINENALPQRDMDSTDFLRAVDLDGFSYRVSANTVLNAIGGNGMLRYISMSSTIASRDYNSLATNLPIQSFCYISTDWFEDIDVGVTAVAWIFYPARSATVGRTQILILPSVGRVYTRYGSTQGVFTDWLEVGNRHDRSAKYFAFGDSTTLGKIGEWSGEPGGISPYNYPTITGDILRLQVVNKAIHAQGLVKDYSTIISDIENLDMTGGKLITVGWAYNDASSYPYNNLGAYTDVTDETIIGKYYSVMKMLQQKCPDALVVLITGYGYSGGSSSQHTFANLQEQFTHNYTFADGQRTVKEFYDELEKMANLHGWNCINQSKGCAFNEFNASISFGDNVHPVNRGYKIYSNYLSARIASIYENYRY